MSEEAKARLRLCEQRRLRELVISCLQQILASAQGVEVLRIALEAVGRLVNHFERRIDHAWNYAQDKDRWLTLRAIGRGDGGRCSPGTAIG